jgi:hypothetical protein
MEYLGNEKSFAVNTCNAPKQVESTVAAIWRGNHLMTPIGGGVQIDATRALDSQNLRGDENGDLTKLRDEMSVKLPENRWWWD